MATPNDRRIVYGTYVVPQIAFNTTSTEVTREEGSTAGTAAYEDWKLDTTVAKRFGGKSTGDHVQITHAQGDDGWVSFLSPIDAVWELRSESDDQWEDTYTIWNHEGLGITDTLATLRSGTDGVKFLYIKNTGTIECELVLEASSGSDERDILIPPGAAVSMRTNSSSVTCATVEVATAASSGDTTTIEYVIAIQGEAKWQMI